MNRLLQSAKFLTLILDTVISIVLTGMAMFLQEKYPEAVDFAKFCILALQPVFVALISAIAYEDAAAKRNGANFPVHTC
jgi:hypothetical protein